MYLCSVDEMRRRLGELIFDETGDTRAFAELGYRLGFDLSLPRVALVIDFLGAHSHTERCGDIHAVLVQSIARYLKLAVEQLAYVTRCGHFVAWVPRARDNSIMKSQLMLSKALDRFAEHNMQVHAIGVGLANENLRGWTRSAEEAMSALNALRGCRKGSVKVLFYSDIVIEKSVCTNESALRYFAMVLDALIYEKDLIRTLQSYFDHRQHRKATAAALNIHPNTLAYRLNRIEMLLDADLSAPSWIARLFTALKLHEASHADTHHSRAAAIARFCAEAKVCAN
jgi:sugar diacid utilization regulator